ncbi:MAG: 3-deoxy-manno-octulosonate cytidylyltransferase [bacterium]
MLSPCFSHTVKTAVKIVIPARYASTRLVGKPLRLLAGKPMIEHVYHCAKRANLGEIIIATDDVRIQSACQDFGAKVCMTSPDHSSGSDRLAEVVQRYAWADDTIIINLQGDEPLTPVACLRQVAANLQQNSNAAIATLATPLAHGDYQNPHVVKVVCDAKQYALYFSRSPIPYARLDGEDKAQSKIQPSDFALRHIGMYAYRAHFLKRFQQLSPAPLEQLEKLEQLRALWHGEKIHVDQAVEIPSHGVDTEADLQAIEQLMQASHST